MSRYNTPQKRNWKNILLQVVVSLVAVFIVVWFLPRDSRSIMSFETNRPWPYGQLIAPYEFYVFKSEAQMQTERDSIRQLYAPYYEVQADVEVRKLADLRGKLRELPEIPYTYRQFFEKRLREVYARGIVSPEELKRLHDEQCTSVYLYEGTVAATRHVSDLFSPKTAYEYIMAEVDSAGLQRSKLQHLNINNFIHDNLTYDSGKSDAEWAELQGSLSPSSGIIYAGQSIIERGKVVTEQDSLILRSFERAILEHTNADGSHTNTILMGEIMYVAIIIICLVVYLNMFRRDYISNLRSASLLVVLILSFALMTSALVRHTLWSVYIIPYAMLPIFVRVFMDSRTAFFAHVCTVLLSAVSLRYPFSFIVTQLVTGLVAIFSLRELSQRSQIFRTVLLTTLAGALAYLSIDFLQGHTILGENNVTRIDYGIYRHIVISGALLLLAYPLMYLLERLFGFTSNVTLVELSNVNSPLLRRLSEVAPGTFQHSVMVSNLAAQVANRTDAQAQLVRTGALYHDIGKMENPEYFTENQPGGVNPHSHLSNRESAAIILRHVTNGLELAERNNLPRVIRDFITTHHGHGMTKYFYISEQNAHPDEKINPDDFTYMGPNPSTKEQAILMMCDAVEASARSLKEYSEESISQLVDRIIDGQMADGFFCQCPITFLNIQTAKDVLKERLMSIYHTRVSYPTLKK